jgi:hypothetical protein
MLSPNPARLVQEARRLKAAMKRAISIIIAAIVVSVGSSTSIAMPIARLPEAASNNVISAQTHVIHHASGDRAGHRHREI